MYVSFNALINHCVFRTAKRQTSVSHPDGVEVGCDAVLSHEHESDDTTTDHTPN